MPNRASYIVACLLAVSSCGKSEDEEFLSHVKLMKPGEHGHPSDALDGDVHENVEPMSEAQWVPASDATHMRPGDPVIGLRTGAHLYALPWWILDNYHVANLTLDGEPICVAFCERCSSAMAFDPTIDGRRLHFRVRGLYNGTILTGDDETGSLWAPFIGKAEHGPLKGRKLGRKQTDQATWADWVELHPDTLVAMADPKLRLGHGSEDAPGVAILDAGMKRSILHPDDRLAMHELVLGVEVEGVTRAYPMTALDAAHGVVQDRIGNTDIVVLHKPQSWLAAAYLRKKGTTQHEFTVAADGTIRDVATKSRWNAAGIAKEGPLEGTALDAVGYCLEEWYIWATQFPGTTLHDSR